MMKRTVWAMIAVVLILLAGCLQGPRYVSTLTTVREVWVGPGRFGQYHVATDAGVFGYHDSNLHYKAMRCKGQRVWLTLEYGSVCNIEPVSKEPEVER